MKHNIIFIAADPWENYTWRRRHHVAWELAKNNRVLFIEPPLSVLQPFKDIDLCWKHFFRLGKLKYQGRNLYSYSPFKMPIRFFCILNMIGYKKTQAQIIKDKIKKIVTKLEFHNPILWIYYHPDQYDYFGLFKEKLIIADWFDKYSATVGANLSETTVNRIVDREKSIISKANIVFAVSENLASDLKKYSNNKVHVIPNGVDINGFTLEHNDAKLKKLMQELEYMKKPLIGFLGIIHNKIDLDLLVYITQKKTDWNLIIMGKEWIRVSEDKVLWNILKNRDNVKYLGEWGKLAIPVFLKYIDVCLLPLKKMEFNQYSAPLKIWEYLAAGKPIVATDIDTNFMGSQFIKTANTKDLFIDMINSSLENESLSCQQERRNFAAKNSWETRVIEMLSIIDYEFKMKNNV